MAALWDLGGVGIYVTEDTDWMGSQLMGRLSPLGSHFNTIHWMAAAQTRTVAAYISTANYASLLAMSGSLPVAFSGPNTVSGNVVVGDVRARRMQNSNLQGVITPLLLVTIDMVRVS